VKGANELHTLIEFITRSMAAGVDLIQIRERDLPARQLLNLTEAAMRAAASTGAEVLVNDRIDVALSAGAGVHLATRSLPARVVRATFGSEILIGVSTHNIDEARSAERGGADFLVFGPVFATESKRPFGPPVGIKALREVCASVHIPVLALGGISLSNFRETLDAGASGIAAISLFARAESLSEIVKRIKGSD
jgi:thiamine-phosphate pyrophosphorylase